MQKTKNVARKIVVFMLMLGFIMNMNITAFAASTVVESGYIGDEQDYKDQGKNPDNYLIKWTFYSDSSLVFSGSFESDFRSFMDEVDSNVYSKVKKVVIKKGVKLSDARFTDFTSLEEAVIEDPASMIGRFSFYECKKLKKISLPEGLTTIPQYLCYGCTSLSSLNIPSSVKTIEANAFYGCPISSLNLKNVQKIGGNAFAYNTALKALTVPASVTEIEYSFSNNTNLSNISFSNGMDYSGISGGSLMGAFMGTAWEKKHSGQIYIGTSYYGDTSTKYNGNGTYEIKEGTKSLCAFSLAGVQVKNLKLPSTLTKYSKDIFCSKYYSDYSMAWSYSYANNARFDNILIPSKVADIEYKEIMYTGVRNIFGMSGTKLQNGIQSSGKNVNYYPLDLSKLTLNTSKELVRKGDTKTLSVKISYNGMATDFSDFVTWKSSNPSVVKIDSTGKIKALKVGKATITASSPYMSKKASVKVEVLKEDAVIMKKGTKVKDTSGNFTYMVNGSGTVALYKYNNKASSKVTIPATVKLKGTTYKVTAVSDSAFKGISKVTTVTIGANVTKIGAKAFAGCSKLKTINIKSKKLKTVGKNAFNGIYKKAVIKVPSSSLKSYKKLITKSKIAKTVIVK